MDKERPLLIMRVTDINRHSHTDNIVWCPHCNVCAASLTQVWTSQIRQKGGIGSAAYDPKQKDIRAFFGGSTEVLPDSDISAHDKITNGDVIVD